MKMSTTLAHMFLNTPPIRQRMAGLHHEDFRKRHGVEMDVVVDGPRVEEANNIIRNATDGRIYVFKKTALEICSKINPKTDNKFSYLDRVPEGSTILVIDKNEFARIHRNGPRIIVLFVNQYVDQVGAERIRYCMFNFTIDEQFEGIIEDPYPTESRRKLFQMLIFMFFTDKEVVMLQPGGKSGTRAQGKVLNDTKTIVTIVDSTWNKILIRGEGFDVRGHLRLQPCGPGRMNMELVWVKPYTKSGYTRKSPNPNQQSKNQPT